MRARKLWRRLAGACGLIALVTAGLLWAATATGQVAYVATHGASMAPRFHQGDLAVVRPSANYGVGEVVAYRSKLLDTVVLHRIVARDGDRYILKGDNNTWLDRDRPTKAQLIGTLLVHVPRAGAAVDWTRGHLLLIAALLVALGATAGSATRQHRRKRTSFPMPAITQSHLHAWRGVAIGLGVLTIVCAAVGALAYTRPDTRTVVAHIGYTRTGAFSYSATAPPGPVYDTGTVATGDPIYLRLVPAVDVGFAYQFSASSIHDASGTIALDAEVADGTGWTHRLHLQPPSNFNGGQANASGHLAVADLQALVAEVRAATGAQGGSPTITLLPDIRINATVGGAVVTDRFQPRLTFQLDPQQLRLTPSPADNGTTAADDPLHPTSEGTDAQTRTIPARLEVMGHGLSASDARRLGLAAGPAALAALAFAAAFRRRTRAETARIELRHGRRIIPVAGAGRDANMATVDVTTMHDLVRLAEQEDRLILHQESDRGDVYLFQTDRTIYQYTTRTNSAAQPRSA